MSRMNKRSNTFELEEAPQRVREAFEDLRDAKRNTSQLSNLALDALPPQAKPAKQQMVEKDRDTVESIIEATLQAKEKELAAAEKAVAILNEEWHAWNLMVTRDMFHSEIDKLERLTTALKGDTLVIRTSRHELCGRMLDNMMMWRQDRENTDWAYLDLLISRYKTPEGARLSPFASRDPDAEQSFQKNVLKAYDAGGRINRWCVISGQYQDTSIVKAAHIVRHNVGELSARHLFGPPDDKDGHLMAAKNGIPMHYWYEQALDDGRLIIVPDGDPKNGRWKVYCLDDPDAQPMTRTILLGRKLHGRSLQFQNDFRPAAGYLYFAFCMSVLRRQRHGFPRWWRDYIAGDPGNMKVWATLGRYLRCSTICKIAHQVGHLPKEEAAIFAASGRSRIEPADEDEDEEMDSLHSSLLSFACVLQNSPTPSTWNSEPAQTSGDESEEEEEEEEEEDDDEDEDEEEEE